MSLLNEKVIVVTGAASGIGQGTALAMAREGAKLVLADVSVASGEQTLKQVEEAGAEAIFVQTDVTDALQVEQLMLAALDRFGRLDSAFNNAGIEGAMSPMDEIDIAEFDRTIAVNLRGVFLCMKYQAQAMIKNGGGSIVNNSSVMGLVGAPQIAAYSASKFGVVGLTKSAALDYAKKGIRINAICPGGVETPMVSEILQQQPGVLEEVLASVPAKRLASPEEIAQAVMWLCSDSSSFVTGAALPVDGAYTAQ
ncbi:SDR family oxidoreductase [Maricurvus nonylphenolicus]|uniref:glucose 1-dehydrogenase n=1 Tax=Maricurvus nonylphenolicus TaxID=1008307 RepID=UPI0036F2ED12